MSFKLEWDKIGERLYETGVDRGVLYPIQEDSTYSLGVAWNGLANVTESPSGAEASPVYADNIKYLNLMSAEDFGASIEAFMYPEEFGPCIGSVAAAPGVYVHQQAHKMFGFSYRSLIGNDLVGTDYGYKIHLVYGAQAAPSEKSNSTVNESPDAPTMSWEVTTTPVNVTGFKPTAHLVIDSTKVNKEKLAELEAILYGFGENNPRLPLPDEVLELVGVAA